MTIPGAPDTGAVTRTPLVTIITVVFNGASALRQTIESVVCRNFGEMEYVIVDGGSTDGTIEIISEYEAHIDCWLSEPDTGIYDAMNKGIDRSHGDYLLFLNAGDELATDLALLRETLQKGHVMVYGKANMLLADGTLSYVKGKPLRGIGRLVRGTPLCHQAILYRREGIGRYDTRYRIMADRVLTYELVKRYGLERTCFVDSVIANYYEGGFSRQNYARWKREELLFLRSEHMFGIYLVKLAGFCFKKLRNRI